MGGVHTGRENQRAVRRGWGSHVTKYLMAIENGAPRRGSAGRAPAAAAAMLSPASRSSLPQAVGGGGDGVEGGEEAEQLAQSYQLASQGNLRKSKRGRSRGALGVF